MKKTFIIFLLIIFSSSFSLAKDNEKITVEDIENIFFSEDEKNMHDMIAKELGINIMTTDKEIQKKIGF
jgi:3-oxoacyl-[acyl-carrier-protein] synthase III